MVEFLDDRLDSIMDILNQKGRIRVSSLNDLLKVSELTIRRDLDRLAEMRKIQRVHGGALTVSGSINEGPVILR